MSLRLWVFSVAYWHDKASADAQRENSTFPLPEWKARIERLLQPAHTFLASGTYSDPAFNPIDCPVINAGATYDGVFEGHYRHYGKCAFTAGFAYALNHATEWDILIHTDYDCLLGDVDLDWLIREFWRRPELICESQTCNNPEGPLWLLKREGVSRMVHFRQYPNMHDRDERATPVWDQECAYIFRGGKWWNPWPQFKNPIHIGRDADQYGWEEMLTWPMVVKAAPGFKKRWEEINSPKTKPYRPDGP